MSDEESKAEALQRRKEKYRKYYEANRERINQRNKDNYYKNREQRMEYQTQYNRANAETIRQKAYTKYHETKKIVQLAKEAGLV